MAASCMRYVTQMLTRRPALKNAPCFLTWRPFSGCHSALGRKNAPTIDYKQSMVTVQVNNTEQQFHPLWLRENCLCSDCFNHATLQRSVLAHHLSADVVSVQQTDHELQVSWQDGHQSTYDLTWLADHNYPGRPGQPQNLWNRDQIKTADIARVPYKDLMTFDRSLAQLLDSLWTWGFGLVEGAPPTEEHTVKAAERISFIQETLFGRSWNFTADLARGDTAYTNIALGAHTDTTYLTSAAGIQVGMSLAYLIHVYRSYVCGIGI